MEEKKKNLIQNFCHIILEKKIALCATKKINIPKKFWTKQKTITPPFKLNGRSITNSYKNLKKYIILESKWEIYKWSIYSNFSVILIMCSYYN